MLLWLWCRPAAGALIRPLAWKPPYSVGVALKAKKKKELNEGKGTESAALLLKVGSRPHAVANGHELFEVSEERDEEVAAFCHMLDM